VNGLVYGLVQNSIFIFCTVQSFSEIFLVSKFIKTPNIAVLVPVPKMPRRRDIWS